MNRRQFLGASLAGIIAALSLPFERFAEWCKAWLGAKKPEALEAFRGIDRALFNGREIIADQNCPPGKAYFFSANAWKPAIAYVNPRDYNQLRTVLA